MLKLPIRTWVCNAAAVFSGHHGAVSQQARQAQCSRETVYEHAQKVEQRLAAPPPEEAALAQLRAENQRLRQTIAELKREAKPRVRFDTAKQQELATAAFAMGTSLRPIEELLGILLSESDRKAPDHSTVGHWIEEQAERAGCVLKVLDPQCTLHVQTLGLDEIFFGGDPPWWEWSRSA